MAVNKRRARHRPDRPNHPYQEEILATSRVARVFKGGRRFRVRVLVVLGDQAGMVGIGLAKGLDVSTAKVKAANIAQKSMFKVAIEETTVPHRVDAKVGGSQIMIKPARQGDGLIAGSVVRTILEKAGYSNVYSKSLGGSNKVNLAYAVIKALKQLVPKSQWPDFPGSKSKQPTPTESADEESDKQPKPTPKKEAKKDEPKTKVEKTPPKPKQTKKTDVAPKKEAVEEK